jgi:hypothetical protein
LFEFCDRIHEFSDTQNPSFPTEYEESKEKERRKQKCKERKETNYIPWKKGKGRAKHRGGNEGELLRLEDLDVGKGQHAAGYHY